jgi:hypothetical protein
MQRQEYAAKAAVVVTSCSCRKETEKKTTQAVKATPHIN